MHCLLVGRIASKGQRLDWPDFSIQYLIRVEDAHVSGVALRQFLEAWGFFFHSGAGPRHDQ